MDKKQYCWVSKYCLPLSTPPPSSPWRKNQETLTPVHHPGRWKPFVYNFGKTLGSPYGKNSTSDRNPKVCSPGICREVKSYDLFSFQILPVSKRGREQVFTDGRRYVAMLLCKWNQVCALTGRTDGSIRRFLKLTGHQQLEVAGSGPTRSPEPTDNGILEEQPVNDSC